MHKRQKVTLVSEVTEAQEDDLVGPSLSLFVQETAKQVDRVCDDSNSLPISNEVKILGHTKGVMALAINRQGTKMASGGLDY